MMATLEAPNPTATQRRFIKYWGSLKESQKLMVIDAHESAWSQGNPVASDVYIQMTENNINVDYLQEFLMEDK
ncbi:hypothetical protein [Marinicella marina]|uniref:hypothetical protein n=1 Tax=Marinicella marina TaxID=2996016 RepID=UPI0024BCE34E|nr:hypothetical protein [Marinicella marina]MDJ1139657.1 hypothetical protein [Marinicella marina]